MWGDAIQLLLVDHLIVGCGVVNGGCGVAIYLCMGSILRVLMGKVALEYARVIVK